MDANAGKTQRSSLTAVGRLLLVGVVGTVLALVLLIPALAVTVSHPVAGFVAVPAALGALFFAIRWLMRRTDAKGAAVAVPDPEVEDRLFEAVLAALRAQKAEPARPSRSWLIPSLLLFVVLGAGFDSLTTVALLIPILVFHELGHLLAMKAFGYRDLDILFIPLLGAAATGKKGGAPAWQQAVVSLMGPAPGLLLGLVGLFVFNALPHTLARTTFGLLFALNALNLLPFEPFDGGRLVKVLVFSNYPRGRAVFSFLTSGVLAVAAFAAKEPFLGVVASMVALSGGSSFAIANCSARTRARYEGELHTLPPRLAEADDTIVRQVFTDYRDSVQKVGDALTPNPAAIARMLQNAYDVAVTPSAGFGAALALGAAYLLLVLPSAAFFFRAYQ